MRERRKAGEHTRKAEKGEKFGEGREGESIGAFRVLVTTALPGKS
jgi:hypothetical protein